MPSAKPSVNLLRELTDQAVLRALMDTDRLTRAELAVATGLSKPTVADAVRRLEVLGLVADTGERTTGRGGVGTYYALAPDVGLALAVSLAPEGLVTELVDARGERRSRAVEAVARPASPTTVERLLVGAVKAATTGIARQAVRVAVVSAADPVDRRTGALVHLPDAPFLVGALAPVETLQPFVAGTVIVDNDVNWAARSERAARSAGRGAAPDDFVYVYLGEGLGCAVVADGQVRRGHAGLAGEIAHLVTEGADGRATTLTAVFAALGLRRGDSPAIDVERLFARVHAADGAALTAVIAGAVGGVVSAAIAFCDPSLVVIGGPWGTDPTVVDAVRRYVGTLPRSVVVESSVVIEEPSLAGAREAAVEALRADILARALVPQLTATEQGGADS